MQTDELQWGRDQLIAEICPRSRRQSRCEMLQWGRDQLIAEMAVRSAMNGRWVVLQWGRDQLIAEIKAERRNADISESFNGAAIS